LIEDDFKVGWLFVVVVISLLELGIDMGVVDFVV